MIFLDTNVVSETLKKAPSENVLAWLVRFDAELALPTVTISFLGMRLSSSGSLDGVACAGRSHVRTTGSPAGRGKP